MIHQILRPPRVSFPRSYQRIHLTHWPKRSRFFNGSISTAVGRNGSSARSPSSRYVYDSNSIGKPFANEILSRNCQSKKYFSSLAYDSSFYAGNSSSSSVNGGVSNKGKSSDPPVRSLYMHDFDNNPKRLLSPTLLVNNYLTTKYGEVVNAEFSCKSMMMENDGTYDYWYNATLIEPRTREYFHSGKCGDFMKQIEQHVNHTGPSIWNEKPRVIDGKIYYRDEIAAKEAAAARSLDCFAFRSKFLVDLEALDETKEPIRYCADEPLIIPMVGEKIDPKSIETYQLQAPAHFWKCLMHIRYGPVNTEFKLESIDLKTNLEGQNGDEKWYSASCIHPITKEEFKSGVSNSCSVQEPIARFMEGFPKTFFHMAEIKIFTGSVFYRDEEAAKNAAAARALDCLISRNDHLEVFRELRNKPRQICVEQPDKKPDQKEYKKIDKLIAKRLTGSDVSIVEAANSFSDVLKKSPKSFMLSCYLSKKFGNSNMSLVGLYDVRPSRIAEDDSLWYTAIFNLPVTNEKFSSGLPEYETKGIEEWNFRIIDGIPHYKDIEQAENAAAARAIDCLAFRENQTNKKSRSRELSQLCLEDPYERGRKPSSTDYESLLEKISGPTESVQKMTSSSDELPLTQLTSGNAMERLVEIWTEATEIESKEEESTEWESIEPNQISELSYSSNVSVQDKIDSILGWYKRVYHVAQNYEQASSLAQLSNKILLSLGNANFRPELDQNVSARVEKESKIILDRIISLSVEFDDKTSPSFYDAETFNSFICCLSRSDPSSSVQSAEKLLQSMENNEFFDGITLPSPNVGTYNAVMRLWSMIGGREGQSGVNELYSKLELASLGGSKDLRPNHDTLKTLLLSNSKKDNVFSVDEARVWLNKIKKHSETFGDEELLPNADVYNSAILKYEKVRNNNTYTPRWLVCGEKFEGGFKSVEESSHQEALDMEEWVFDMERNNVDPTIDTYEAMIQAWIETGTVHGLLKAENWAKRALHAPGVVPSMRTMQPIVAAWALCGNERSPERVKDWIKELDKLGATFPHLKPDMNMMVAQIIALRNQIPDASTVESVDLSDAEAELTFAAAQNCTKCLEELLSNQNNLDPRKDYTSAFRSVIGAWGDACKVSLSAPQSSTLQSHHDPLRGVHEMLKIVRLCENNISSPNDTSSMEDDEDCEDDDQLVEKQSQGLAKEHILKGIGSVYTEILTQLHGIDRFAASRHDLQDTYIFLERISDVERMLRLYEFNLRETLPNFGVMVNCNKTSHDLYKQVLTGIDFFEADDIRKHSAASVVRICSSILKFLSFRNEQLQGDLNGNTEDLTDLFVDIASLVSKAVSNPHERMMVLTKFYDDGSPFFQKQHEPPADFTVDKARLIGAMRLAMGDDSDMTESFIKSFDTEERPITRRRTVARHRSKRRYS